MKNFWKQCVESGIAYWRNIFLRTRIILTIYYVSVVTVIMSVFSIFLYLALEQNLQDSMVELPIVAESTRHLLHMAREHLAHTIITIDSITLIVVAVLCYLLAGWTLRPIKRALDDQRAFSADASHELRTPLAVIQSESEVLLRTVSPTIDEYRHVVMSAREEVLRMKKIVDGLLVLARSEQIANGRFQPVDLGPLLDDIVGTFAPIAIARTVILSSHNVQDTLTIKGHETKLRHAFGNVLKNALDFTPSGKSVIVRLIKRGERAIVEIVDTGTGITQDDLPHVFERFYKSNGSREERNGTGLGLAITKEIIENHNGLVSITSTLGEGTCVVFDFPLM